LIVVNKWDLVEKETNTVEDFKQDILDVYPSLTYFPILFISILHNLRVRNILKIALSIHRERCRKVKTVELNIFLKKALQYYPPPATKGKNISIKYVTQVYHSPPIFAFFTNHPDLISIQYKRYLENSFRDYFGFLGTPIKISFRKSD
jgi:GTP-binding protein